MYIPKLLDLYCGAGGATRGYQQAGFHVTGVDIAAQPNYCGDVFIMGDAVEYARHYGANFDVIHASPPCQAFSLTHRINDLVYPDLIAPTREVLNYTGRPWVMENVVGAPLLTPTLLCGAMFGLRTYRHRLFEPGNGVHLAARAHPVHVAPQAKMGRPVGDGEFIHVVGHFSDVNMARRVMELPHANRDELSEAIPAAYTRHVGESLWTALKRTW